MRNIIFTPVSCNKDYNFIIKNLRKEGLTEKELPFNSAQRSFWVMKKKNNIIGFIGIKFTSFCILEYFWILPKKRRTSEKLCLKMGGFLKKILSDSKIKNIIIDTKSAGKFEYLPKIIEFYLKITPYLVKKGSSYYNVPTRLL